MTKYNEFESDDYLLKVNRLNIADWAELEEAEAFAFTMRAIQVERGVYKITGHGLPDFMELHKHLFQDIYPFAGKFRDVQLMKGSTRFCQVEHLHSYAKALFNELTNEPSWTSLTEAATRMSYYKAELNMLHPFREGNGRTIRIFLQNYAKTKNYGWAFEQMAPDRYLQAMIRSVTDEDLLFALFLETLIAIE